MSVEPRMYMLECGHLQTTVSSIKMNQGSEPYEIPVPWYLIMHPKGNVIIDGGNPPKVAEDPIKHWGKELAEVYWPTMTPDLAVLPQLEKLEVDPASIRWVVQSHLHIDHVGAVASIEHLPNAQVLASRTEYEYAHNADWFSARSYVQDDFNDDRIDWVLLDESDDGYDVIGDGRLRCWFTPGHSPGHMSFSVNLPQTGSHLLCVDAAYTLDHWNEQALPGFMTSALETARSVQKLKRIARRDEAAVVTGHDPVAWPGFKHAPEHYA